MLAVHAAGAVAAWRLLAHGFAWGSLRFVANSVLPAAVFIASAAALVATLAGRTAPLRAVAPALFAGWLGLALGAIAAFPRSVRPSPLAWMLALVALLCALAARRALRPTRRALWVGASMGALLGGAWSLAQRAPAPSTRPANPPALAAIAWTDPFAAPIETPRVGGADINLATGATFVSCGGLTLQIEPLLTFISRTPDRGWTILTAPRGPERRLTGVSLAADRPEAALRFADDGESWLLASANRGPYALELEARSVAPAPVFTHLNTFTVITVMGHRRPALAFSPCAGTRVVVAPSDYPTGRPVTFAYLDAAGTFRLVRARDAEKGPFTELAAGPLPRGAPLAITLYDDTAPACRVTFDDWSAQASTEPSPTAGWGVPQNAVEFFRDGERDASPIRLVLTLASTSVGRGFDSVGHAAGTYRNRVHVEPLR